jgi:Mg/Co/Ni transporter MgtE
MVQWLKRLGVEMLAGAVLGFVTWCLAGKTVTSMWFGSLGGTFSCQTDVQNALTRFLSMQLYSAIAGAFAVSIGLALLRRAFDRRKPPAASTGPAQSSVS